MTEIGKDELELWVIFNGLNEEKKVKEMIRMIINYFDLNKERIKKGWKIYLEYKDTPDLLAKRLTRLFEDE